MKTYRFYYKILFLSMTLSLFSSCTKMDEEVYSNLRLDDFFTNEEEVIAAMAPIYTSFRNWTGWQSWWDVEETTDVAVTPVRGYYWYDGGIYLRLHRHEWTQYDPHYWVWWNLTYNNINNCNRVIYQLENAQFDINGKDAFLAELKTARAYMYYNLCSLYGNVPIIDKYDVPDNYLPATNTRKEVFDFVVADLKESIPNLNPENGGVMYGRFNKWAGLTLLARMYINAEEWVGIPMWNECIDACNQVISSGKFLLEGDFKRNYALDNDKSKEMIYAWPYDEQYQSDANINIAYEKTLHPENLAKTYLAYTTSYDGVQAVPSFVNTFTAEDKRLDKFVKGPQYGADGKVLRCIGIVARDAGKPIDYTNTLSKLDDAGEDEGYRLGLFEIKIGTEQYHDNDWPTMRYAEVLFMKAECLLRSGGTAAEAADLVNQVRERAFDVPNPVTADELTSTIDVNGVPTVYGRMLMEWGWEFCYENLRRDQQIRFGNFITGTWTAHTPSEDYRKLFPIPADALSANKNLTQNPGY